MYKDFGTVKADKQPRLKGHDDRMVYGDSQKTQFRGMMDLTLLKKTCIETTIGKSCISQQECSEVMVTNTIVQRGVKLIVHLKKCRYVVSSVKSASHWFIQIQLYNGVLQPIYRYQ
ncbi:uncharacterized protein LOC134681036 [Mytilus trossulus]|uniref:uncharacterized protein LOC134681036 n=1 Tax=Mytilus trossulus TaxID=6551 RepID=UPI00300536C4